MVNKKAKTTKAPVFHKYLAKTPTAKIVTITPDDAIDILRSNHINREIRPIVVDRYALDMTNGDWGINGEAIKIAADGTLIDGHHRLQACVNANVEFKTFIVYGLTEESVNTIDTGRTRSIAAILKINGFKYSSHLATTVCANIRFDEGGIRDGLTNRRNQIRIAPHRALAYAKAHPKLQDAARMHAKLTPIGMPGTVSATLHRVFYDIDANDAEYFFDHLYTGVNLDEDDPIWVLRQKLINLKHDRSPLATNDYIGAITIKAWNAYREGRSIKRIMWRNSGTKAEAFPTAR